MARKNTTEITKCLENVSIIYLKKMWTFQSNYVFCLCLKVGKLWDYLVNIRKREETKTSYDLTKGCKQIFISILTWSKRFR